MAAPTNAQFTAQATEKMSADKRREWCKSTARDAERKGARWHRYRYDHATSVLTYEGWKARPDIKGDPIFHLINGPSGGSR